MSQITLPNLAEHPLVQRLTRLRSRVRWAVTLQAVGLLLASVVGGCLLLVLLDYLLHIPALLRGTLLLVALGPASPFLLVSWYVAVPALLAGLTVGLAAVILDHTLDLTNRGRSHIVGIALTISLGAVGYLVWRRLLRPMSTRLSDQFLASRIEDQNRDLSDELMSAVNFIHHRAGSQNALAARHIDLAARHTEGIRFENAVDFRRGFASLAIAGAILALAGILTASSPELARIALQRWFTPADARWPHYTNVDFLWVQPDGTLGTRAPKALPVGESYIFHAAIDKGANTRVLLTARTDASSSETHPMTFTPGTPATSGFRYEYTLAALQGSRITLRLQAGDDTDVPPVVIPLAPRPVMTQIRATVYPPDYVRDVKDPSKPAAPVTYDLLSQPARAAPGSLVKLDIKSSKPFEFNAQGEPNVGFYVNDILLPMALNRSLLSSNEALVSFTASSTIQAQLKMTDTDGLLSNVGDTRTLEVLPDALPTIRITEPANSLDRAPNGVVQVSVQAADDWGFAHLRFRADKYDAKPGDPHAFETPADVPWQELTVDVASGTTGSVQYTWDLEPLHLEPGTRLLFYGSVQDNYTSGDQHHPWVDSAPFKLQIRSVTDILEENRKALSDLNERIRSLKVQQEQTRLQADSIRKIVEGAKSVSPLQQQQLADLAQQQSQQAVTAGSIRQSAAQISQDLQQNKLQDNDLAKIAKDVSAGMDKVGQQNMPQAATDLTSASQDAVPQSTPNAAAQNAQQSAKAVSGATQQQDQAIARMDDLIKQLGAVGDFESLRNETSKLLDQQKALNQQTQAIGPKAMGATPDALKKNDPATSAAEEKLAADQQNLSDRTADLLDRMDRASQPLSQSDPASAQSLQSASNAGRNAQISSKQKDASGNLSSNQVSSAAGNQQTAEQGLQQMLDELNKNDQRRLEQLAREVRELLADVQKLRDDEDALHTQTTAAGPAVATAAIQKLADQQDRIQQNSAVTEKKAENTRDAGQAAAYIQEASDHMGDAATALYTNTQPPSLKPETDAIAALDNAIAELKKLQDRMPPDDNSKQLSEFIKQYQAIQTEETEIKASTQDYEKKRLAEDDHELTRLDSQGLGKVTIHQGDLADRINALSKDPDLAKVEVVVWMNQQVTEAMDTSKAGLAKVQLGNPTLVAEQAAIDRLQLIIDALKEEQQKPSEFSSPSGGGGGGGGGKPPLVPPIAQLKLLKAMQIVVNDQTKSVDQDLTAATTNADKNEIRTQAQDLGEKEGRIHDMASDIVDQLLQNQQQQPPATQPRQ